MVAWLAGNISDEATTPASNIFNEAMRQGIPLDIMTPPYGTIWGISKGHISLVQRRGAK